MEIQECCQEKIGWRVLGPNCNIRYEGYSDVEVSADPPAPAPAQRLDGREMAVERLPRKSGQGLEAFKNEVM